MSKNGSIKRQIVTQLQKMKQPDGASKHAVKQQATAEAKQSNGNVQQAINNRLRDKIYSDNTLKSYTKQCVLFGDWVKQQHPECKTVADCRPYVDDYLQQSINRGLSAWTIKAQARRLGKLYQCPTSDFIATPRRRRADITRSRGETSKHYSETNNADLRAFCRATGLRRAELERLRPERLHADSTGAYLEIKGKGGKIRQAPIIGENRAAVVAKIQATPAGQKVWGKVHNHAPIHAYRADYRTAYYKQIARPIERIKTENKRAGRDTNAGVYYCRGDKRGTALDKWAMAIVSKALGHNRIDVIAGHYLR